MNPLIQRETRILPLCIAVALGCFSAWPRMVVARGGPPPNCNTSEGFNALFNVTTGVDDTAFGGAALFNDTTGSDNTATGCGALVSNTTGNYNTATGSQVLSRNDIGGDNTASGYQALYNNMSDRNTAIGAKALFSNTVGYDNTACGAGALYSTNGVLNTAAGAAALYSNTTGNYNTATGARALESNTTGSHNTATGHIALFNNTSGVGCVAVGDDALFISTTGSYNTGLGYQAGLFVTTATNVICIGAGVVGADVNNSCFIGNIRGVTTTQDDAIPVVIDSAGQLGTTSSSCRFKTEIKPMGKASEAILSLKPVTFRHKNSNTGTPQFGLIAEDVAKVNADLVVRDKNGEIYTVRYDALNAMLLNEFLKGHRKVEEQQKEIDALKAELKEQKALIQKVSDRVELNEPTLRTVVSNQ